MTNHHKHTSRHGNREDLAKERDVRGSLRSQRDKELKDKPKISKKTKDKKETENSHVLNNKKNERVEVTKDGITEPLETPKTTKKLSTKINPRYQFKDSYNNKKEQLTQELEEEGLKEALNTHAFGLGTVLEKGLSLVFSPITVKLAFAFLEKIFGSRLVGVIALLSTLLTFLISIPVVIVTGFALLFLVFASALAIILLVEDGTVDKSGIDFSNIGIEGLVVGGKAKAEGIQSNRAGMSTPEELRGKFLYVYADVESSAFKELRGGEPHWGTDYQVSTDRENAPIYPVAEGVVISAGGQPNNVCGNTSASYGYYVTILHKDIIHTNGKAFVSRYAHMKNPPMVKEGDTVSINTQLGVIGSTGCSTGPHLHFELIPNGENGARQKFGVDPKNFLMCSETKTRAESTPKECFEYQKKVRGVK